MEDLARVYEVSTHSRLKAAEAASWSYVIGKIVSTHSRLKAAEKSTILDKRYQGFNTQPPEGGCQCQTATSENVPAVSTHSRLKAADN